MLASDDNHGPRLTALRQQLPQALARDRDRLRAALDRARARPDAAALDAVEGAIAASLAKVAARAASIPPIRLDESLPVSRAAERIIELIGRHRVLIVAGETGSGKTTQLPKLCLAAGRGRTGMIGCTQPRRLAARSVARRVATELGGEVGGLVGFQVRFNDQVGANALVKFMTDGILLAETQSDRSLSAYDTLIIDEAHERSLNIDFLLGYLKRLLERRPDLKLIVTSATIDTERFARHFGDAPVIDVEGRGFPVEVRYRPPEPAGEGASREREPRARGDRDSDRLLAAIHEIGASDGLGDVLVFLPGEREIRDAHDAIERARLRETEVLPLYARLSARDQDRIFNPGPKRRIVLATNVAETSLTVPRIRYVVDLGLARLSRYNHRAQVQRLHIEAISQASANQRAGRCGRVGPGICYRLYDQADFDARARFTDPEILRSSLAGVILRMLGLGLGAIEQFPFLDAPPERAIKEGYAQLLELGAISADKTRLTAIGRQLNRLPIDVKLARMLVAAAANGALAELLVIAAFLSVQDPRERPVEARAAADAAHARFADPASDFIGVLKLWQAYSAAHEELTQSKLRGWCEQHFVAFLRMREWRELHRQLLLQCEPLGFTANREAASFEAVHRALISGLPGNIGRREEKTQYQGPRGRRFQLFPGSALTRSPPPWVVSATLLDTQKLYAIGNARIEPAWVIAELPQLIRRNYLDPHWDRASGQVKAYEQVSLFGLMLVERRRVFYGSIDPVAARQLFIRAALVPCEIDSRSRAIAHNRAVLAEAAEEEAKQRRHGLLRSVEELADWWDQRLPAGIAGSKAFDAWALAIERDQAGSDAADAPRLQWTLAEVLQSGASERERFPDVLVQGQQRLRLDYHFAPGAADDGVSLQLPLGWLNAVDPQRLTWLVPGLLEALVSEWIRALPKSLRRNFVPAPDFARAFADATPFGQGDLPDKLRAFLLRVTGVEVSAEQGREAEAALPAHLRFRICLLDERGQPLASSRDLAALQQQFGERARSAFASKAASQYAASDVRELPAAGLPVSVQAASGLLAYPALVDRVQRVDLAVFESPEAARTAHRAGLCRLLEWRLAERLRSARKQLPLGSKLALAYTPIASPDQLRSDIVAGALAELLEPIDPDIRSEPALAAAAERLGRQLFVRASERLAAVEASLAAYVELLPRLNSPLLGFAKANFDDLREQLAQLIFAGFAATFSAAQLRELPRYLKAMRLRAERLQQDPRRDQARMLPIRALHAQLDDALRSADPGVASGPIPIGRYPPDFARVRFALEELRVQTFAQELGTREPVSEKRVQKMLDALRG
ncbi:MAG: ATP-dependent RNA helicase HrpA [Lysobacterales bacterium]